MTTVFTIAQKSRKYNSVNPDLFFAFLRKNGVKKIVDVRRSASDPSCCMFQGTLMPWCCAKVGMDYVRALELAPRKELYQQCNDEGWNMVRYAHEYLADDEIVRAIRNIRIDDIDGCAIMCHENELYNCHRWLIVEALKAMHHELNIVHLGINHDRQHNEKGAIPLDVETEARAYIRSIFC